MCLVIVRVKADFCQIQPYICVHLCVTVVLTISYNTVTSDVAT